MVLHLLMRRNSVLVTRVNWYWYQRCVSLPAVCRISFQASFGRGFGSPRRARSSERVCNDSYQRRGHSSYCTINCDTTVVMSLPAQVSCDPTKGKQQGTKSDDRKSGVRFVNHKMDTLATRSPVTKKSKLLLNLRNKYPSVMRFHKKLRGSRRNERQQRAHMTRTKSNYKRNVYTFLLVLKSGW